MKVLRRDGATYQEEVDDLLEPSDFESWPCNFLTVVVVTDVGGGLFSLATRAALGLCSGCTFLVLVDRDQSLHNC